MLSGECRLLVEGVERLLRLWDFFHSPAGTEHIFVGTGNGPCVILMAGARSEDTQLLYPVSELAARYGASAEEETTDPKQAYAVRAVTAGAALILGPPPLDLIWRRSCQGSRPRRPVVDRGGLLFGWASGAATTVAAVSLMMRGLATPLPCLRRRRAPSRNGRGSLLGCP